MATRWSNEDADNLLVVLVAYLAIGVPLNFYLYHDVIDKRWRTVRELRRYCVLYTMLATVALGLLVTYATLQFDTRDYKEGGAALLSCFIALYGLYLAARQISILRFYHKYLKPKADSIVAAYVSKDGNGTPVGKLLFPDQEYRTGPVYDNLSSVFLDDNYPGEGPRVTWLQPTPEVKDWTELMVRTGLWIRLAVLPATASFDSALRPSPPSSIDSIAGWNALWTVAALKLQFLNTSEKSVERNTIGEPERVLLKTFIECVESKEGVNWQGAERSVWHVWKSILAVAPASEWSEAIAELPSKWNEGITETHDLPWEVFLALALNSDESDTPAALDVEESRRAPQGLTSALPMQQSPPSSPSPSPSPPPPRSPSPSTDETFKSYVERRVKEALIGSDGHVTTAVLMGGFPSGDRERNSLDWIKRVKEIGQQTHRLAARMDIAGRPSTSSEELTVGVDLVVALALLLGAEVESLEFSSNRMWAEVGEVLRARRKHVLHKLENCAEAFLRKTLERHVRLQNSLHPDVAQSRFRLGKFLQDQGKHEEAETLYSRAIQIWEKNNERANVANGLNAKAESFRERGKFEKALLLYDECLAIRRDELGGDHPDVATALSNKGDALMGQAKYTEAEGCYQQALITCGNTSDGAQLRFSVSNNLAKLYMKQGKYTEAKKLYKEALNTDVTRHGEYHPDVARDRRNLAMVLEAAGEYMDAEEQYVRAIEIWEDKLGREAVPVGAGLIKLAGLFKTMGRLEEAEPLYRRATSIDEKALGKIHPDVARDFSNWAELLQAQAKFAEAEPLYERAVFIGNKTLGTSHPDVAVWLNKQGEAMLEMGQFDEARNVLRRSLNITDDPGKDDPTSAQTRRIMGRLCCEEGKYAEAESLFRQAQDTNEKVYGPEHPEVAIDLNNRAELFNTQGKHDEASPLYARAIAIQEKALGPQHPDLAVWLNNRALSLEKFGKYDEAESLFKRSQAIREKALGPEHPDVAQSLNNRALLLEKQGKYADADPLYLRAIEIGEKTLGPDHPVLAYRSTTGRGCWRARASTPKLSNYMRGVRRSKRKF
ncbi:unnamed protein product [Ectocarpus sp. 4 AP-2014]